MNTKTIKQLTEMMQAANAHPDYEYSFYRHLRDALRDACALRYAVDINTFDVNWGGNESWYMDLLIAVRGAALEQAEALEELVANDQFVGKDKLTTAYDGLAQVNRDIIDEENEIILIDE